MKLEEYAKTICVLVSLIITISAINFTKPTTETIIIDAYNILRLTIYIVASLKVSTKNRAGLILWTFTTFLTLGNDIFLFAKPTSESAEWNMKGTMIAIIMRLHNFISWGEDESKNTKRK